MTNWVGWDQSRFVLMDLDGHGPATRSRQSPVTGMEVKTKRVWEPFQLYQQPTFLLSANKMSPVESALCLF
jgi:hypothetical protein